MDALAALLTRERLLAELVVFKLVELRQLLVAGEVRFLGWAAEEVERATGALRDCELQRALLVAEMAEARGLAESELTLSALVADASEPWRTLLAESAESLSALWSEAQEHVAANRRLAESGVQGVEELLGRVAPAAPEDDLVLYGPDAARRTAAPRPRVAHHL